MAPPSRKWVQRCPHPRCPLCKRYDTSRRGIPIHETRTRVCKGKGDVELVAEGELPLCYSSPDANPSEGSWKKCDGGVADSPMDLNEWPPWDEVPSIAHFTESCDEKWSAEHDEAEIRPYWRWVPANCRLEEVDAARFCRMMEGRKGVLLVGDSLTREFSITLASILRAKLNSTGSRGPDEWMACDGELPVKFIRNDFLDLRSDFVEGNLCREGAFDRCFVFADDSILEASDVVVVNSGAHLTPGGMHSYEEKMKAVSARLTSSMERLHGDNATLVVRNTSPGHSDCTEKMFGAPVSADTAAALVAQGPTDYQWTAFENRNKVLQEAFEGSGGRWRWLDVYSPTVLRADCHRGGVDCLHYCLPGPIDHWVVLLYHILLADHSL
ncbi:unnamed protein product [Scytosiphon promiscuus]